MDEVRDKVKGFMKKVNLSSSSSSGKFKGQGRVIGSSSSGPTNPMLARGPSPSAGSNPNRSYAAPANPNPQKQRKPQKPPISDGQAQIPASYRINSDPNPKPAAGFDPFESLVTSGKRSGNGLSLNVFECPVCGNPYGSEEEVSAHVESCIENPRAIDNGDPGCSPYSPEGDLGARVGFYLSAKPPEASVEVVLKLLRNIGREPENAKFRRVRMSNPKIQEAVGEVAGCIELLECVGFELREEDGEMWAVMEVPREERVALIRRAVSLLEPPKPEDSPATAPAPLDEPVVPKKIDRQVRVFFPVSASIAGKIQLPDSFYNLTLEELKREADMRKKKIADCQLLIPKSLKEKQAMSARRRYKRTVIRVQFPDNVVLQGIFYPAEPTTVLYEFVSSALKQPDLEFELLHPVVVKRRVIPHFAPAGARAITLEEEDLVPSALIKFRPTETDSLVFTGLCNELLEISEPLIVESAVAPL